MSTMTEPKAGSTRVAALALATAVAMLCYAANLVILPGRQRG
jgi:hypothetical protein